MLPSSLLSVPFSLPYLNVDLVINLFIGLFFFFFKSFFIQNYTKLPFLTSQQQHKIFLCHNFVDILTTTSLLLFTQRNGNETNFVQLCLGYVFGVQSFVWLRSEVVNINLVGDVKAKKTHVSGSTRYRGQASAEYNSSSFWSHATFTGLIFSFLLSPFFFSFPPINYKHTKASVCLDLLFPFSYNRQFNSPTITRITFFFFSAGKRKTMKK